MAPVAFVDHRSVTLDTAKNVSVPAGTNLTRPNPVPAGTNPTRTHPVHAGTT